MQKLFFELLQVALGRLDCEDRAPLEEEWPELYRISRQQGIAGTCYQGVEKLFEFGLRGPQDLMLDWMAEAEEAFDADVIEHYADVSMKNPLKNSAWQRWLRNNETVADSNTVNLMGLLVHVHEQFVYGQLTLHPLLNAFHLLRQLDSHYGKFADERNFEQQLKAIHLLKFTRGLMWVQQETMALERRLMPCEPLEDKGRFILSDIMGDAHGIKHWLKKRYC